MNDTSRPSESGPLGSSMTQPPAHAPNQQRPAGHHEADDVRVDRRDPRAFHVHLQPFLVVFLEPADRALFAGKRFDDADARDRIGQHARHRRPAPPDALVERRDLAPEDFHADDHRRHRQQRQQRQPPLEREHNHDDAHQHKELHDDLLRDAQDERLQVAVSPEMRLMTEPVEVLS